MYICTVQCEVGSVSTSLKFVTLFFSLSQFAPKKRREGRVAENRALWLLQVGPPNCLMSWLPPHFESMSKSDANSIKAVQRWRLDNSISKTARCVLEEMVHIIKSVLHTDTIKAHGTFAQRGLGEEVEHVHIHTRAS